VALGAPAARTKRAIVRMEKISWGFVLNSRPNFEIKFFMIFLLVGY